MRKNVRAAVTAVIKAHMLYNECSATMRNLYERTNTMTCRHKPGDPNCSSHPDHKLYEQYGWSGLTPDVKNYMIEEVAQVGPNMVLKVKYPNCKNCAYEGTKVMVYLNVTALQAMRWRVIDPHFKDPKRQVCPNEAPAPAVRFPASPEGWQDALDYAQKKATGV